LLRSATRRSSTQRNDSFVHLPRCLATLRIAPPRITLLRNVMQRNDSFIHSLPRRFASQRFAALHSATLRTTIQRNDFLRLFTIAPRRRATRRTATHRSATQRNVLPQSTDRSILDATLPAI
jgi:hypothetical protein